MKNTNAFFVALMLFAGCAASFADSAPFSVLSAHNNFMTAGGGMNVTPAGGYFTINSQFEAVLLAPLSTQSEMSGNIVVAAVGPKGEVYQDEYVDALPQFVFRYDEPVPDPTPEPGTLALMGSGILFMAGLVHMRKRV